jgi:hypothetical protein
VVEFGFPIRITWVFFGIVRLRDVSSARVAAVAFHRFKIGQQVLATAFGVLTGPYEITRLLPLVAGVPYYRAKTVRRA